MIGDQPKFTMVVTNIGLVACKRDVGAAVLAAYVYSLDNKRLWSNLDCAPSNETLVKTFNPGEQVTTEVTWTGMGSAPQCPPSPRADRPRHLATWWSSWATYARHRCRSPSPTPAAAPAEPARRPPARARSRRARSGPRACRLRAYSSRSVIVDSANWDSPSRT